MKKIFSFLIFLFLILALPVFADNLGGTGGVEDLLDSAPSVENAFVGQKKITDEEFQKTLNQVKAKQKKGKKPKAFKGRNFNEENNGGYLGETAERNLLLEVPVSLTNGDGAEIPIGHYKIVGKKVGGNPFLDFYQSSTLIARVPAIETNNDFDEMAINFVKLLPYDEKRIKVIYGSMDFNAYTFIKIKKEISDMN
ncbi:MAG: hypothetical protein WCY19_02990 [Candidatus Gastranaerophilaceae bacterium]